MRYFLLVRGKGHLQRFARLGRKGGFISSEPICEFCKRVLRCHHGARACKESIAADLLRLASQQDVPKTEQETQLAPAASDIDQAARAIDKKGKLAHQPARASELGEQKNIPSPLADQYKN